MKLSIVVAACEQEIKASGSRVAMLGKCLESILAGGHADFEALVCSDGHSEAIRETVDALEDARFRYACVPHRGRYGGGTQRNAMTAIASGDLLLYIDDDDRYVEGALATVAAAAEAHSGRPLVFCMRYHTTGRVLWTDEYPKQSAGAFKRGHIGTPMLALPNVPEKLGRWGLANYSDGDFVESCKARGIGEPLWYRDVIAIVRCQGDRNPW